ncbi:unnamed protein product [Orchesella dallaii]|uniref:Kelch domain-containing protein 3 n=1 Tax=Orchesella dallaii TaxID=48710 RepID=A0ABP1Q0C6_9HEXA
MTSGQGDSDGCIPNTSKAQDVKIDIEELSRQMKLVQVEKTPLLIHSDEVNASNLPTKESLQMHWTVHIEGGPKRVNHAAVVVGHTIYSFGGYCTDENYSIQRPIDVHILQPGRNDQTACRVLYRFDTKTLAWSKPEVSGSVPGARDGHSAVIIRHKMYIFGGYEEEIGLFSQDVYALDLNTLEWTFVPAAGTPPFFRDFHTATVYLDRYMLIFGGRGDQHGPFHTRSEKYCNVLVYFDCERQEWVRPKTMGAIPVGRRSHSAFMHGGFLYVGFGYNGLTDEHFNDFYRYDPETGEWKALTPFGNGPKPRRRQGCVTLDNRVYFFGGTSPMPTDNSVAEDTDMNEETNLIDHDDMFILDMDPSLKTLCLLKTIEAKLDTSGLPLDLMQEIAWMKMPNKISPMSSG